MKTTVDTKAKWLAREIVKAYPHDCPGLKIYLLDCSCLYYRRVFRDGSEDDQIGIYRNPAHGPCEICMALPKEWMHRVVDETVAYNAGPRILKGDPGKSAAN